MSTSTHRRPARPPICPTSWSNKQGRINVTYDLPSRVFVAETYPLRAPNGSSIIVYGHERGLTCLWKGGKLSSDPSKRSLESRHWEASKGSSTDDVIVIEDDRDGNSQPQTQATLSQSNFDTEEEETDALNPFDTVIDSLDIPLNAAAIDVAFCPLKARHSSGPDEYCPIILSNYLVIAVACADSSIHLVRVQLAPPLSASSHNSSRSSAEDGFRDVLVIDSQYSGRNLPRGLSLTWTPTLNPVSDRDLEVKPDHSSKHGIRSWSFLLAFHYAAKFGVLKIFEIPLDKNSTDFQNMSPILVRHEHLSGAAKSLYFSPSVYPSERHTQLLLTGNLGLVHIFQLILPALHQARNTDAESEWLVSLRSPFEHNSINSRRAATSQNRIDVLDAQWAFAGKCIVALLADGQWGVWDLTGIGPSRRSNLLSDNCVSNTRLISGAGITRFMVRGYIGNSQSSQSVKSTKLSTATTDTTKQGESTKLVPMTPITRKAKQNTLFTSTKHTTHRPSENTTGGISLCPLTIETIGTEVDESLLIWYNSEIYSVPSLLSYWQHVANISSKDNKIYGGDDNSDTLFGPSAPQFKGISTGGELITRVSQSQSQWDHALRSHKGLTCDVLLSAEHRLVMSYTVRKRRVQTDGFSTLFRPPQVQVEFPVDGEAVKHLNQEKLVRGNLNLRALDRIVDSMDRYARGGGSKVGFLSTTD